MQLAETSVWNFARQESCRHFFEYVGCSGGNVITINTCIVRRVAYLCDIKNYHTTCLNLELSRRLRTFGKFLKYYSCYIGISERDSL